MEGIFAELEFEKSDIDTESWAKLQELHEGSGKMLYLIQLPDFMCSTIISSVAFYENVILANATMYLISKN